MSDEDGTKKRDCADLSAGAGHDDDEPRSKAMKGRSGDVDSTPLPCRGAIPVHHFVRCDRVEGPGWRALFACAKPDPVPPKSDPIADYLILLRDPLYVLVDLWDVSVFKYATSSPFVLVLECELQGAVHGDINDDTCSRCVRFYNRSQGPTDLCLRTFKSKWVLALEFSSADARAAQRALVEHPHVRGQCEMSPAEARRYKAGTHPHLKAVNPPRHGGRMVDDDLRVVTGGLMDARCRSASYLLCGLTLPQDPPPVSHSVLVRFALQDQSGKTIREQRTADFHLTE